MNKYYLYIIILFMSASESMAQIRSLMNASIDTTFAYGGVEGYQTAPRDHCINILILGDGYIKKEMTFFRQDVKKMAEKIITSYPFSIFKDYMNFYQIEVISKESGIKHPAKSVDADPSCSLLPQSNPDNYFGTTFDFQGIHRGIYPDIQKLEYLKAWYEMYKFRKTLHVTILIANSNHPGGTGGEIAVTTLHKSGLETAIHELGHSFGKLCDEYWQDGYETEGPNKTRESDPNKIPWKKFLGKNSIGIYPFEGNRNWFKPHPGCKMCLLSGDFCDVCANEILQRAKSITGLDEFKPIITGINSPEGMSSISVFPNPASGLLHVNCDEKITRIDIFNYMGELLRTFNQPKEAISVNNLPSGMYFLLIRTKTKMHQTKIIVK